VIAVCDPGKDSFYRGTVEDITESNRLRGVTGEQELKKEVEELEIITISLS
jgi:hypothetical protein